LPFTNSFIIPEDWEYVRFSEVVLISPPTKIASKTVSYVPMDAINIEKGSIDYFEKRDIEKVGSLPKFQENDVLFARITPSTENGKVCIVKNFSARGIASSELIVLRPTSKVLPDYLYFFVKTARIRKYAISQMKGTTGRQRVPDSVFKNDLYFELPGLKGQMKIVDVLSKIHNLTQKADQIIEHTQRLKKGLMQKLLTNGIGHEKFKKEHLAFAFLEKEIPTDWNVLQLKTLCRVVRGGSPRPAGDPRYFGGDIPWITVGELTKDNKIYLDEVSHGLTSLGRSNSRFLERGTVVLANSGATLGVPKIIRLSGCINDGVAAFLDIHKDLISEFLYFVLFSWINLLRNINQGIGQPNLNTEIISNLYFPLPPINEQQAISNILLNISSMIDARINYQNKLKVLKNGLMHHLLTGKIRVKA
jgi:type I restriction enzyme S subunit